MIEKSVKCIRIEELVNLCQFIDTKYRKTNVSPVVSAGVAVTSIKGLGSSAHTGNEGCGLNLYKSYIPLCPHPIRRRIKR